MNRLRNYDADQISEYLGVTILGRRLETFVHPDLAGMSQQEHKLTYAEDTNVSNEEPSQFKECNESVSNVAGAHSTIV